MTFTPPYDDLATVEVESTVVRLFLSASRAGLWSVSWGKAVHPSALLPSGAAREWAEQGRYELEEYLAGRRRRFYVPLDWRRVSGFQQTVLEALLSVPYGETVSYRQVAEMSGRPAAVRAVGNALHNNPWPIIVPCHRVVRSSGDLGGYGGGIEIKRWLLKEERRARSGADGAGGEARERAEAGAGMGVYDARGGI
jgi:methylated-DNA-[protein]-cysteine S-methyltransferase